MQDFFTPGKFVGIAINLEHSPELLVNPAHNFRYAKEKRNHDWNMYVEEVKLTLLHVFIKTVLCIQLYSYTVVEKCIQR